MFEKNLLNGQTIVITGGGTGLGKSMSRRFGELGANIVISGRRKEKLEETADEFSKLGINVLTCPGDVRKLEDVELMTSQAIDKFGKIDGLLNNAAGNFISPTEMLSPNAFKVVIDIVLMGTWNCTSTIGKEMIKNKKGNVLSIVTTYAWTGSPYVVPSAAAKAGVLAMTRSLAVEWGKYNIRFNAIAPGPFPTKGAWSRLMPPGFEDFEDGMKNKIPMKRFGERHELENLASYLMSDGSAYINGEVVTIDGGEWLAGAAEFSEMDKIPDSLWKAMAARRKKK
ncbi:MAG: short-chain dehydrogenase [Candidatus Neomarinimicrobiota bacterium]|uniref:2,4-dienoyl-CoA reductase n=1 Tax=marine metagenome TaxID=408172 RepID=A0A381Q188_9ZZZZ|nr:SDR family oxidoreductase [Candidatus Neomarinimicrobiota bacterium]MED5451326.1 SDR family oxidoreductase [Candidatus Neomarinimicrobiota bacterium]MEE3241918.1 SDR family oxidoreductase [Candidatus Neomarinimicrobiota bacterium]GIT10416.1 MAG: short-chain dehydrogenase [Candidatus Neomarinimicrobiota bacterium]GIT56754.1 MAG: short-chain dehydrogenase [Candidatus Neomarinimicrobiota bacterium]|tara:strand:+ start:353 stop:1201 length:849 start_codon:yes stop_codon:yes gene_type:complete